MYDTIEAICRKVRSKCTAVVEAATSRVTPTVIVLGAVAVGGAVVAVSLVLVYRSFRLSSSPVWVESEEA